MGPVPFTLSAEVSNWFKLPSSTLTLHKKVFPLENRVVGMSFAVFLNLFGAGILTLVVPSLTVSSLIGCSGRASEIPGHRCSHHRCCDPHFPLLVESHTQIYRTFSAMQGFCAFSQVRSSIPISVLSRLKIPYLIP